MTRRLVAKPVLQTVKTQRELAPALYIDVCDWCRREFEMREAYGLEVAVLKGIFSCAAMVKGRSIGNVFLATCCSFACADELFRDGWRKLREWRPFVRANAELLRAEIRISRDVSDLEEVLAKRKRDIKLKRGRSTIARVMEGGVLLAASTVAR